ncbi:hypothetical protein CJJ23_04495 [Mycoplasmopsis agassizii]|uniref:DNA topoisomerase (ATP-hydrolyzing) n=1 Tax=Mycoplasmopsis agassizii TaxID=33922 RepID=A0A269THM3_9BACT|nr:DNA topoisomerase IV subunit A [Mycoplasmopsis agassizii]PAK20972.1 hypothetical protein CJJ23_04495 [Mycoplasmopsis agassizii]
MAKKDNAPEGLNPQIYLQNLDEIMSERFGNYSKYVIQERALPDARDGLKPVQRRILFSMHDLKLYNHLPYKKSARVVGDVIGKYHPHGDTSIYDAMIRLAQDWKMALPLVQMHGNIGSVDDDPAAAMRYTESRLAKVSELMLKGIEKNIVKFVPNFDDTEKEPTVLPSFIPNLLINGSRGIASGFATEIPPHNINEVIEGAIAMIRNPNVSLNTLMKHIKGPDFPTGGIISGNKGIIEAFETGKGRVSIRSKYEIVKENKQHYISIKELPYGIVKSKLVFEIDQLLDKNNIAGVEEVLDVSDRDGIEIQIKLTTNADAKTIINYLMSKTQLRVYYSYNNIAIYKGYPTLMNLHQMLGAYIDHFKDVNNKIIIYDLNKAKDRLEIVEGFLIVSQVTDKVIKVIRESNNAKKGVIEDLIREFKFTERQATAIAEMQLYRLSKTDFYALQDEKTKLLETIAELQGLLKDESLFNNHLIKILKEINKNYTIPRRTLIEDSHDAVDYNIEDLIEEEDIHISMTKQGYLKRVSQKIYDSNNYETYSLKEGDEIVFAQSTNTKSKLISFTNQGNFISIPLFKINSGKWKEIGQHLSEFVKLNDSEKIINTFIINDFSDTIYVNFITKLGLGKRTKIEAFDISKYSKPVRAIKIKSGDQLASVSLSSGGFVNLVFTNNDLVLKISENDFPLLNTSSMGNIIIKLNAGEVVNHLQSAQNKSNLLLVSQRNYYMYLDVKKLKFANRGNKGQKYFEQAKTNQHLVKSSLILDYENKFNLVEINDVVVFDEKSNSKRENQFSTLGRNVNYVFNETESQLDYLNKNKSLIESNINKKLTQEFDSEKTQSLLEEDDSKNTKDNSSKTVEIEKTKTYSVDKSKIKNELKEKKSIDAILDTIDDAYGSFDSKFRPEKIKELLSKKKK